MRRRAAPRLWRKALAIALAQALANGAFAQGASAEIGRQIYLEGRAGTEAITARRAGGLETQGNAAACVHCHRRSALGGAEGRTYAPPIDARALFTPKMPGTGAAAAGLGRDAYSESTLQHALSAGLDPSGRPLDYLMPRYALDAAQVSSLIAYLQSVSQRPTPGISDRSVHLATVMAGDVSPAARRIAEQTLQACVAEHNAGPQPEARRKRLAHSMGRAAPMTWQLHVWNLQGPPTTWDAQLREHARQQPVFAMLGGMLGAPLNNDWSAVHAFCEREALPCLYPQLQTPPTAEDGVYSVYASGGVRLEAGLIAQHVQGLASQRVVQWLRSGDTAARAGADALRDALQRQGIGVEERLLGSAPAAAQALQVLWLRSGDLAKFQAAEAASDSRVYLSASLLAFQAEAVPLAMRPRALMAYPHELPQHLGARRAQLQSWLANRGLAFEDEALQADAYMACNALQLAMSESDAHLGADFLLERLEALTERRGFAGLYPRLSLGVGQRVASKTGYLVRFASSDAEPLEALGDAFAP